MSNIILVNNVEIEKSVIYDFLIQNKKLEAVKFVMEKAGIGMNSAKEIVAPQYKPPISTNILSAICDNGK